MESLNTQRFWSKVEFSDPDDCWLWLAGRDRDGYGRFWRGGREVRAHRFALESAGVEVSDSLVVCHSCDVPACVNPRHLWVGTHGMNQADKARKGRAASGAHHGWYTHPESRVRLPGERHPQAKLSDSHVREIRNRVAGGEMQRDLAQEFGVAFGTISKIVRRTTWAHI